jgi:3-dehydroquinate synthetase
LPDAGVATSRVVVPVGEGSKSFRVFEQVCEAIIAARIERGDLVVALGGGVIGDLAGFAASAVRRGLDYVQVPTTLLAQVDSSVGGKTAINSATARTSIGAFPSADPGARRYRALDVLAGREFRAGYAEVAKYGLLGDAAFFSWLEANWRDIFAGGNSSGSSAREHAIAVSCRAKAAIVARDERETGERAIAQSRPHLRPCAGGGVRVSPTGCCTARRLPPAWRWHSPFRRGRGWCHTPRPSAPSAIWRRSACRPGQGHSRADCPASTN